MNYNNKRYIMNEKPTNKEVLNLVINIVHEKRKEKKCDTTSVCFMFDKH